MPSEEEYKQHKESCSKTFSVFGPQLSDLNRAIFGDEKLLQPGIQAMTREMYAIIIESKAKKSVFPKFVGLSGGITTIIVMFYAVLEFLKKVSKIE